ncbi:MAG: hypothetical protein RID96_15500 [Nitratireductor sp.]
MKMLDKRFDNYPRRVPGTDYVACRHFTGWAGRVGIEPHTWVETQVRHVGDDPGYSPATADSHPHLSAKQRKTLNAPHGADYRQRVAVARDCDVSLGDMLINRDEVRRREHIHRVVFDAPDQPYEDDVGGYVPFGAEPRSGTWGEVVSWRQRYKEAGDFETSDAVRKVLEGGGIDIMDTNQGTLYFFPVDDVFKPIVPRVEAAMRERKAA